METKNPIKEVEKNVEESFKKTNYITIGIVIAVIILAYFLINKPKPETPEAVAKCIGEKSIFYSQEGCIHCINQKKLFGENVKFLNIYDCTSNWTYCEEKGITGTPTWILFNGTIIEGKREINYLANAMEC